mmetsp:Transcript_91813/g.297060  ORF Transcript_91813/g.297060 Transcript_91813/m.297060 type:complete len:98 (-) Transcript_91813:20-313(-)
MHSCLCLSSASEFVFDLQRFNLKAHFCMPACCSHGFDLDSRACSEDVWKRDALSASHSALRPRSFFMMLELSAFRCAVCQGLRRHSGHLHSLKWRNN